MKLIKALAFVAVAAATPAVSHAKVEMKTAMDSFVTISPKEPTSI